MHGKNISLSDIYQKLDGSPHPLQITLDTPNAERQNLKRSVRSPEEHGCQVMSSRFCTLRAKKSYFEHCCQDVVGLLGYERIAQCNFDPPICCVQVPSENIVCLQ
ncbi:hypothetical protein AFLA_002551 [Aspergillus flavus NRRL3357]|nr:hypothetical protein AFLA_002551 [Aspergillus flavus NRRL3357]